MTAGSFWAGNYLVDYALYRADQAPQSANDGKAPVNETYGNEEANKAEEQRLTDLWLETVVLEKKEIVSHDGLTLRALQYTADPTSHRYALVIHGYTSNKEAMQTEARHFSELGYTVITPDNRCLLYTSRVSTEDVASSRIRIFGSARNARAIVSSCF